MLKSLSIVRQTLKPTGWFEPLVCIDLPSEARANAFTAAGPVIRSRDHTSQR
jgi:hypothetical protein